MNRKHFVAAVLTLALLCLFVGPAWADHYNAPDWESNPYYTRQSWEFPDGVSPAPAELDQNPFGTAIAYELNNHGVWQQDLGQEYTLSNPPVYVQDRTGGWMFEGLVDGVFASIDVPNDANQGLIKEIWFEATFKTNSQDPDVSFAVNDNLGNPFDVGPWNFEPFGVDINDGGIWARSWIYGSIDPQPLSETIIFSANLGAGEYILVDEIDVDTRCVPEPSTVMMLLGTVAIGLVGCSRRWRRRAA